MYTIPMQTDPDELSVQLSDRNRTPIDQALDDWRGLQNPAARMTWLHQHLFPSGEYMKRRYDVSNAFFLPWFYLWRILWGGVKLLRPR